MFELQNSKPAANSFFLNFAFAGDKNNYLCRLEK
jgi:hypothetical protein